MDAAPRCVELVDVFCDGVEELTELLECVSESVATEKLSKSVEGVTDAVNALDEKVGALDTSVGGLTRSVEAASDAANGVDEAVRALDASVRMGNRPGGVPTDASMMSLSLSVLCAVDLWQAVLSRAAAAPGADAALMEVSDPPESCEQARERAGLQ